MPPLYMFSNTSAAAIPGKVSNSDILNLVNSSFRYTAFNAYRCDNAYSVLKFMFFISLDFVTIESDNTDLTGPMVAYVVITAEAALLSDVFETEVPALVVFWVRVDLDAD